MLRARSDVVPEPRHKEEGKSGEKHAHPRPDEPAHEIRELVGFLEEDERRGHERPGREHGTDERPINLPPPILGEEETPEDEKGEREDVPHFKGTAIPDPERERDEEDEPDRRYPDERRRARHFRPLHRFVECDEPGDEERSRRERNKHRRPVPEDEPERQKHDREDARERGEERVEDRRPDAPLREEELVEEARDRAEEISDECDDDPHHVSILSYPDEKKKTCAENSNLPNSKRTTLISRPVLSLSFLRPASLIRYPVFYGATSLKVVLQSRVPTSDVRVQFTATPHPLLSIVNG